jgi:hypothetical protein
MTEREGREDPEFQVCGCHPTPHRPNQEITQLLVQFKNTWPGLAQGLATKREGHKMIQSYLTMAALGLRPGTRVFTEAIPGRDRRASYVSEQLQFWG